MGILYDLPGGQPGDIETEIPLNEPRLSEPVTKSFFAYTGRTDDKDRRFLRVPIVS